VEAGNINYSEGDYVAAGFAWSEEAVVELRKLLADGVSASIISAAISVGFGVEVSRSAVLGKIHRLGLSGKPSPDHWQKKRRPVKRRPVPIFRAQSVAPPLREPPPLPTGLAPTIRLLDRNMHSQCAFPYGEPGADMMCCGRPIEEGSYCCAHRLVTHIHSPSRHRAPLRRAT